MESDLGTLEFSSLPSSVNPWVPVTPTLEQQQRRVPVDGAKSFGSSVKTYISKNLNVRSIKKGTTDFFGVVDKNFEDEEEALKSRWLERRKRFSNRKYGLKDDFTDIKPKPGEDEVDYFRRTHTGLLKLKTLSTETDGLDQVDSEPMPRHAPSGRKEPVSKLTMQGLALIAH
ncbi:unnamed protein product, partial [Notodromas monacha]